MDKARTSIKHGTFQKRYLTPAADASVEEIAHAFDGLLSAVQEKIGANREMSLVKTKLEEAYFFAIQGVAQDPINWRSAPTD